METTPSPPPMEVNPVPAPHQSSGHRDNNQEENTITNFMTTCSHTGANKAPGAPAKTIIKIIIPKHMLQTGDQVLTVLPGGVHALQPTLVVSGSSRQQMAPAPPPLHAKPREGSVTPGLPVSDRSTSPPPLQFKGVPASVQGLDALPIDVPSASPTSSEYTDEDEVIEVLSSEEDEVEVNGCSNGTSVGSVCVRAGCNNPAVESQDWDKEYCSNECVATHCRDIFQVWCSIRNQIMGMVK